MGILRIIKDAEQKSFEPREDENPFDHILPPHRDHNVPRSRLVLWFTGIIIAAVTGITSYFYFTPWVNYLSNRGNATAEPPFVYFELKISAPDGSPAIGAFILHEGKRLGISDSFGEWRRYMKVRPGDTYQVEAVKHEQNEKWHAEKKLHIPKQVPISGDLEVKEELRLKRQVVPKQEVAAALPVVQATTPEPKQIEVKTTPKEHAEGERWDTVAITIREQPNPPPLYVAAVAEERLKKITLALTKRMTELGVRVSEQAAWRINVAFISDFGRSEGLYLVESHNAKSHASFLRNHIPDLEALARSILWGVRQHTPYPYPYQAQDATYLIPKAQGIPQLFTLRAGELVSLGGHLAPVKLSPKHPDHWAVNFVAESPCVVSPCDMTFAVVPHIAPQVHEKSFTFWGEAGLKEEVKVFVGGYEVGRKEIVGDKALFQFHGQEGIDENIAVIDTSTLTLVHRARVRAQIQPPLISLKPLKLSSK